MPDTHRMIGEVSLPSIGLGCMNLSHAYGVPPGPEVGERVLLAALDLGITHFDTAALYGFGRNEDLVGRVLAPFREHIYLASKCGMTGVNGKRLIDGRPQTLKKTCEEALQRLKTDVIDLYYLHRWDREVPLEDSIGALKDLVADGKIKAVGLSEVSAETLRKAHAVHPVAAVQSEYSLWSRNAEVAVLDACAELGVAYVAFSPLARGFLADMALSPADFAEKDIRLSMPRFQEPHFSKNAELLATYRAVAHDAECTPAQLALAWLLQKASHIHVIPGTTSVDHLSEDLAALEVSLSPYTIDALEALINPSTVSGPRYNAATQVEIDTEEIS